MGKLTSIYNFVPLNQEVFYPSWADMVSQDAPFSDGEDGVIEVTLRNVSPLFIRNGSADRDNQDPHSAHVMVGGKRLYFLPGSSIKGMLRTTLEIMSFGKMTQYTERFFSKRELGGKQTADGSAYVELMKGVKPAWLRQEGEKLFLTPCDGNWLRIGDAELKAKYPSLGSAKTGWAKNKAISKEASQWYPIHKMAGAKYRIVCTGNINKKSKDYLFPTGRLKEVEVEERIKTAFFTVHEPSPDFDKITEFLKSGRELAVFYLPGKSPYEVRAIGISAMLRYPYKQSVSDLVKVQQSPTLDRRDLAEAIFGYISPADSMRGRVQIGNAFADKPLADSQLRPKVAGVLGQPKASFYPFYLKQTTNPYKTYDTADGIAGRKLYRVHRGSSVTTLPLGNGNENALSRFIPIPEGQVFHLRIAVHNLRKTETGALLSALTLHQTKNAWHNIGLAKGYGYGKLEIEDISLSNGFALTVGDYLKAFERQMSLFTYTELPSKRMWADTPQVAALMEILGEHDDADLHVMEINSKKYGKEYVEAKRHFDKLVEKTIHVTSLLSETDKAQIREESSTYREELQRRDVAEKTRQWSLQHKADYEMAEQLHKQKKFDEAIAKYNAISHELSLLSLDHTEVDAALDKVRQDKEAWVKEQEKIADDEKEAKRLKLFAAGLAAFLDEKYANGTANEGKYKVADYALMGRKADHWMQRINKPQETALTDSEKEAYAATFQRLYPQGCHPKKEDKALKDRNSKIWQNAKDKLGDRFEELLGNLLET